jgi:ABC-type uncharacterized transport system substrate-binding protein
LLFDRHPSARVRAACALAAAASVTLVSVAPAAAHPHVWVEAKSEIVFDEAQRFAGIRQFWTFDEAYSALMTINLDGDKAGAPDADKLAELAKTNLASIAEFEFFTHAKANGKPVAFGPPEAPRQTFSQGRLHLEFLLPLKNPMAHPKVMVLSVNDPSFFVAFSLAPGPDAVGLAGPKTGCALNVTRQAQVAEVGKQIIADEVAASAAPGVVGDYTSRAILACP